MKRRIIASVLALTLVVSTAFVNSADADAAKKKPSLKKKAEVTKGKTVTLKLKNGNKKAKVTWKSSKPKFAKITKQVKKGNKASAKVKGVKKGKSVITASYKLGKKTTKFKCTVTVSNKKAPTPVVPTVAPTDVPNNVVPTDAPTDAPTVAPTPTKKPTATPKPTPTASPVPSPDAQIYKTSKDIVVDGTIDAAWAFADEMAISNWTPDAEGKESQSSNSYAKAMWTDTMMYLMVSVDDPEIDFGNEAAYYQDSIEIFFDEYNNKFAWGGGNEFQYRTVLNPAAEAIGSLTDKQFWDGEEITTAFTTSETGYVVEYSIPLHAAPVEGNFVGIEVQVNDASAGERNGTWNLFANPAGGDAIPYDSTEVFGDCQYAIKRETKVIELDFTDPANRNMELPTQFSERDENNNVLYYDEEGNVICIGVVDPESDGNKIASYTDASGNPLEEKIGTAKGSADYATMNTESFFDDENNAMHCKTANNAIVRFPEGRTIVPGEKAEVKIKGTYAGENGFRIWLVDTSAGLSDGAATSSNQVTILASDLEKATKEDGTFELTFELTGEISDQGEEFSTSDAVMIKASTYNGQIEDLVFTSVVLTVYDPISNEDMTDETPGDDTTGDDTTGDDTTGDDTTGDDTTGDDTTGDDTTGDVVNNFVTLSLENEAINDPSNEVSYADGKATIKLSPANSGYGVAWYFNAEKSDIDISEYSKVVINYTSDAAYNMVVSTKQGITSNNYWNNGSTEANLQYTTFAAGTNTYELPLTATGHAIFVKWNTYGADPVPTEKTNIVINSIELVK